MDDAVTVIAVSLIRGFRICPSFLLKVRLPPRSNRRSQRRKSQQRPFDDFEEDRVCNVLCSGDSSVGGIDKI